MGVTISTHNGSSMAYDHNIRNKKVVSKESHIDPNGVYEIWIDEPIRKAYDRLFGVALEAYNAKQSRSERQIDSYYHAVCKDKKKHPVYEMVIGVYGKNENGSPICSEEQGKEIMRQFVENWRERNPNLELIGAYYHADEPESEPHVHLDYVPVAHGYKRGLETQTGLVKALFEQGFEKKGKETAQIQWERRENDYLTNLCERAGLIVEHPKAEERKHIDTATFKLQTQIQQLSLKCSNLSSERHKEEEQLKALKEQKERLEGQIKRFERYFTEQLEIDNAGKAKIGGKVVFTREESETLKAQASNYWAAQHKADKFEDENKRLHKRFDGIEDKYSKLKFQLVDEQTNNKHLKQEFEDLNTRLNRVVSKLSPAVRAEFVNEWNKLRNNKTSNNKGLHL